MDVSRAVLLTIRVPESRRQASNGSQRLCRLPDGRGGGSAFWTLWIFPSTAIRAALNTKSIAPVPPVFTYQPHIGPEAALDTCAELYGRIERKVFADIQRGEQPGSLKSTYLRHYAIPARMFNAARIAVEGKIQSVQKLQVDRAEPLRRRIRKA